MGRARITPGLDVLVDALPHAVLILDADGTVVQSNAEAERLLGRGTLSGHVLPRELSGVAEDVRLACAAVSEGARASLTREVSFHDPDGSCRWLEFAAAPFGDGDAPLAECARRDARGWCADHRDVERGDRSPGPSTCC